MHKPVSGRGLVKLPHVLCFGGIWLLPHNLFSKILPQVAFSVSDHLNMLLVDSQGILRKREADKSAGAVSGVSLIKSFTCNPPSLREENSTAIIEVAVA